MRWVVLVVIAFVTGCIDDQLTKCGSIACPVGTVCDGHGGCAAPEQLAVCASKADGDACSYGSVASGACSGGLCVPIGCGNGILQPGEVCDDGNNVGGDGCSADCQSNETCGNGIVDPARGEQCDPGLASGPPCRANCTAELCGDGIVDPPFETCDAGSANSSSPDAACRPNCQPARCGDAIVDTAHGEVCDDGNLVAGDGCSPDCRSNETCGNGIVDFAKGEECDDGNARPYDGCSGCRIERTSVHQREVPPGSARHSMAYDAGRQRVVLFTIDGQTWEWDGAGWWRQRPRHAPQPREFSAMAYDAVRHRTVLFGGDVTNGSDLSTWTWDGVDWTEHAVAGPSGRGRTAMAFDGGRGVVVLFGGLASDGTRLGDTWTWNGTAWTHLTPATTPTSPYANGRYGHSLAYDAAHDRVVLIGMQCCDDITWTWDGTDWTSHGSSGIGSGNVDFGSAAYDPIRGRVVYVDSNGRTWEWNGTSWLQIAGTPPTFPTTAAVAYDIARQQLVFANNTFPPAAGSQLNVWLRTGTTWAVQPPPVEPPARMHVATVYDPLRERVVLVGGVDASSNQGDIWEWDGRTWTQSAATTTQSANRSAAYDPASATVLLYDADSTELSRYDGTQVTLDSNGPQRGGPAFTYDTGRATAVVFGGVDVQQFDVPVSDTFEDQGGNWNQLMPTDVPAARTGAAMVYDPVDGYSVLFGGGFTNARYGDTWRWDGNDWTAAATGGPSGREGHAMVWNPDRGAIAMYGDSGLASEDVWEWRPAGWTEVTPLGGALPPVDGPGLSYDSVHHALVAIGGCTTAACPTTLIGFSPLVAPEACTSAQLDYDGDGLAGCADDECWPVCAPLSPPGQSTSGPYCGDGACSSFESCELCPTDCGACTGPCGDYVCDTGETHASCPLDCP